MAARFEAARLTEKYVEQPKTSQRREGLDMKLALDSPNCFRFSCCHQADGLLAR